jgi:hypothetical protein
VEKTDWEDSELELERAVVVEGGSSGGGSCKLCHCWCKSCLGGICLLGWVAPNKLLYEKRCIGTWEGRICDRKFVSLLSVKGNKTNFNET